MKILNPNIDLNDFLNRVKQRSLLMLDYDGTLAPFVKDRMLAFPYPGVSEKLESLSKQSNVRVIIISGRSLADLEKLLVIKTKIELWGSHGLERRLSNGEKKQAKVDIKLLNNAIKVCQEIAGNENCEIKPYGVAFHWRGMDSHEKILNKLEPEWKKISDHSNLEMHSFDHGLELRPKDCNKGHVVKTLLSETPEDTALAYFGDDLTDEDAFAALGNKGLKVLVRTEFRPTLADIYLIPPHELMTFLDKWKV